MPPTDAAADELRATFERLYRTHRAEVYRWGLRYGGGRRAWAEDLAHDVFLRLHAHLPTLGDLDALGPWLYRAAANCALNRLRNEQSWLGAVASLWRGEDDEAPSPESRLSKKQLAQRALRSLPAKERVVLCMKVLDGKSQQEIAQVLGLSEGYVSKLTARAWALVEQSGWEGADAAN